METKTAALEIRMPDDSGTIVGYGSVFGVEDMASDVVVRGSFADSLQRRRPHMLWQHYMDEPIGRWSECREDDKGLYCEGKLALGTTRGREAYELLKAGAISGLSIGFVTRESEMVGEVRRLTAIDLYEISLVTMPAQPQATVTGVKSMTARDLESVLRANGFSRSEAKAVVASGWKGIAERQRDAGNAGPETIQRDAGAILERITREMQSAITGGRNV